MTKILLVEDDKSLREIYGVRLLAEGYDIVSAGDGEEALAMAIKERPALIVSDVMMPKISGFDMLDILRSTTETRDVKVIMMTALSSEDQRQRGEALGADRYLVKSQVGIEDVVRTVHEVLGDAPEPTPAPEPAAEPVAAAGAPTTQQDAPAVTLPSPTEIAAADAQARQFLDEISAVPAEQRTVLESDKFAGPIATQVVTPAPTAPMAPLTQDGSATTPTQANPDNSTPPATDPAPFVLPSAAPTPAAPSAPPEPTAGEPVTPTDPAPTPTPEVEQTPVSDPAPSPEPAPTPPADTLPQPTAPVSSPSPQPTSHGGERVIQPLSQEPQPDMSKMMEQELSDQLESMQASPQPAPDSNDFTLPTPNAMAEPHGDLTLDALEPLPTPADDQPLDTGTAINAELANAASSQPQDDDTPFVLPTPAPMPTDPAPTPEGEPSPATEPAQPTTPQPPTNAFPPQPPVAS
ncbi:response regulator [Candidatus Saccharibacteria bacterium oral taxon 488]|nr:response regulator [Candidatus Saccharibacteria bacterium oral taxon 488]QLF51756.1 response regulator [Candidatus Saccharibacteria bacterium oral taxon 488]